MAFHIQLSTGISLLATSNRRDSLGLVATQEHQMRDEKTVGHPMKDDILQMPRDAFPARTGISDNDAESRENVGTDVWCFHIRARCPFQAVSFPKAARAVHLAPPVDAPMVLEAFPYPGDRDIDVQEIGCQGASAPLEVALHGMGARVAGYALHVRHGYTLTIAWLQMSCVSSRSCTTATFREPRRPSCHAQPPSPIFAKSRL